MPPVPEAAPGQGARGRFDEHRFESRGERRGLRVCSRRHMALDTIPHRLFAQAETRPDAPAYHHKVDGRYRPTTWSEYAALCAARARR